MDSDESTAITTQPAAKSRVNGPKGETWDTHKELICFLYSNCDKSLKEVSAIMSQLHNFRATDKMYKSRFKKWGVRKNLKSSEVRNIRDRAISGQDARLPVSHGRQLGSEGFRSFVEHWNATRTRAHHEMGGHRSPMPMTIQPDLPDRLKATERVIREMLVYSSRCLETKQWTFPRHELGSEPTRCWWVVTHLASLRFSQERYPALGFEMLGRSFDILRSVAPTEDSLLIWCGYMVMLALSDIGVELARSFERYAIGICSIVLGRYHSLTIMASNFMQMDVLEARRSAVPVITTYFDMIFNAIHRATPIQVWALISLRRYLKKTELVTQVDSVSVPLLQESRFHEGSNLDVQSEYVLAAVQVLAASADDVNLPGPLISNYDSLLHQLDEQLNGRARERATSSDMDSDLGILRLIGEMEDFLGRSESAEHYFEQAVEMASHERPADHDEVFKAFVYLEYHYRSIGDVKAARAVSDRCRRHCISGPEKARNMGDINDRSPTPPT